MSEKVPTKTKGRETRGTEDKTLLVPTQKLDRKFDRDGQDKSSRSEWLRNATNEMVPRCGQDQTERDRTAAKMGEVDLRWNRDGAKQMTKRDLHANAKAQTE